MSAARLRRELSRTVVDLGRVLASAHAVGVLAQVQAQALDARHALVPFGERLLVNRADAREALVMEAPGQRSADEAARAGHENAANDLAWFLCTGQAGAEMDPLRGLSEVEALIARLDTPHPYFFSTLAACQAALGEFAHARASQRIALRRALKELPEETDVHEQMGQRLALYEADQAYVWVP